LSTEGTRLSIFSILFPLSNRECLVDDGWLSVLMCLIGLLFLSEPPTSFS